MVRNMLVPEVEVRDPSRAFGSQPSYELPGSLLANCNFQMTKRAGESNKQPSRAQRIVPTPEFQRYGPFLAVENTPPPPPPPPSPQPRSAQFGLRLGYFQDGKFIPHSSEQDGEALEPEHLRTAQVSEVIEHQDEVFEQPNSMHPITSTAELQRHGLFLGAGRVPPCASPPSSSPPSTPPSSPSPSPRSLLPSGSTVSRHDSVTGESSTKLSPVNGTGLEALSVSKMKLFQDLRYVAHFDGILRTLHAMDNPNEPGPERLMFEGDLEATRDEERFIRNVFEGMAHRRDLTIYKDVSRNSDPTVEMNKRSHVCRHATTPPPSLTSRQEVIEQKPFMNRVRFMHLNLTLDFEAIESGHEEALTMMSILKQFPRLEKVLLDVNVRNVEELKADKRWRAACWSLKEHADVRGLVITIEYHVGTTRFFADREIRDAEMERWQSCQQHGTSHFSQYT